jgi:hypothetical protein
MLTLSGWQSGPNSKTRNRLIYLSLVISPRFLLPGVKRGGERDLAGLIYSPT